MNTRNLMRWAIYLVLGVLVAVFLYNQLAARQSQPDVMSLQELATEIKEGNIETISIDGDTLDVERKVGGEATSYKEPDTSLVSSLANLGVSEEQIGEVEIKIAAPSGLFGWLGILSWVLPLVLISAFFLIIFRQAQSSGNQAISFGKQPRAHVHRRKADDHI